MTTKTVQDNTESNEADLKALVLQLRAQNEDLKKSQGECRKLLCAVESSSSVVLITDLKGNIEYVNPKFTEVTGYLREEVMGKNPSILKSGETSDQDYSELWDTISSGGEWRGEFHNRRKDGSCYWARNSVSGVKDEAGKITHYICVEDDITNEYQLNQQLSFQASHDALTGLINRTEFLRRAERLLSTYDPEQDEHAMCFMDLDQFKAINDTCGHIASYELLRQLGQALQTMVRHRDTLARIGGDQFAILMEHCSLDQAHRVATDLQQLVSDFRFSWEGTTYRVGTSIGLVVITDAIPNVTELLKLADSACYLAKESGRNRIHVHQLEDSELVQRLGEMQWVTRIEKALKEDRFCLYAQSIISLDGKSSDHFELLLRMLDEDGNIMLPGAFLPVAERYGIIEKLDSWVVTKAFELLGKNKKFFEKVKFVSINLSGQSISSDDFLEALISQLATSGIDPGNICFEISETVATSNLNATLTFIGLLKEMGCLFALDNFGSGLSSFGYLKNIAADYLKIDEILVRGVNRDKVDYAVVKSINEIGQAMGMQTIAEFVEDDQILAVLKKMGVNCAQGFGISRPQPFEQVLER